MDRAGSNIKADGVDSYTVTLKPRDTYGNIVNTGSLYVSYTGTVSKVQIPSTIWAHPYIGNQDWYDALIID